MQHTAQHEILKRNQRAGVSGAHRGTSLVEVLVVLAILTIGIFAIIRIFPEGFISIKGTGNSTKAQGLTDELTDYLRKNQESLPDGIAALDPFSGNVLANVHPLDMQSNFNYIDNPFVTGPVRPDPRFSQFNKARRVFGETVKIPAPVLNFMPRAAIPGGEVAVSVHYALFAPLYTADPKPLGANVSNAAQGMEVYSATPHSAVAFQNPPTSSNDIELTNSGIFGYGINYQLGRLLFTAANAGRTFKIEFAYDAGGGVIIRQSARIVVPAATTAWGAYSYYTVDLTNPAQVNPPMPAGAEVYPGSDVLYRYFDRLGIDTMFDPNNPFEYKVYDRVSGLIGFNPRSSLMPLPSRQGRGLSARIDYDLDDWEVLHQDIQIPRTPSSVDPANPFYAVKLFTNRIKKLGDFEEEVVFPATNGGNSPVTTTSGYEGLMRHYPGSAYGATRTGTPGLDVVIVDVATGFQIDNRTLAVAGVNTNGEVNHSLGVLQLRPIVQWQLPYDLGSTVVPPAMQPDGGAVAGRLLRVYFRHRDHFAMAVEKPYSSYREHFGATPIQAGEFQSGPFGYLLFPLADAEKTIAVDYVWRDLTTGEQRRDVGEMIRVKLPNLGGPEDPATGTAWARLANGDCGTGNCNPDAEPGSIRVLGVRGVSIKTHVAWRESPRWRHLRRTAMLTREVTR